MEGTTVIAPTLSPIRWWRDDEIRYLPRPEYRAALERRHFNLSEIPRGEHPELDAFVADYRDRVGFFPIVPLVPLVFEQLKPMDPLDDVARMRIRHLIPEVQPSLALIFFREDDL